MVLIPIKDFRRAKNRLAERLDAAERVALAQRMASAVIRAAHPNDVRVVCSDREVASWAEANGAGVLWVDVEGLNPAVEAAVAQLAQQTEHVLIAHADLPQARTLAGLATRGAVSIVPDRHHEGTNVLALPTGMDFRFKYGQGSLHAHVAEALARGLDVHLLQRPELQVDVDTPEDLDAAVSAGSRNDPPEPGEPAP